MSTLTILSILGDLTDDIGAAGLAASVILFVISMLVAFPWSIGDLVADVVKAAKLEKGETSPVDMEEVIYQIMRSRLILAGLMLVFCLLLMVCSTVMIVSAQPMDRKEKPKDSQVAAADEEPDSGSEEMLAKPTAAPVTAAVSDDKKEEGEKAAAPAGEQKPATGTAAGGTPPADTAARDPSKKG